MNAVSPHVLDPLLRPRSVAVVGASARADTVGDWSVRNLQRGRYAGTIYPVNPGHREIAGLACYPSLTALPELPDLVIFALSDARIEAALDEAIALGVPAAVIMSSLVVDDDAEPPLRQRVQDKARAAGMLVCGANGMGYYNVRDGVWACGFDSRNHEPPGAISLISHSGSGMSGLIDCDERLWVNFAVSTGNEISVTMDQYLDFVLDLPETRVVGLFIETARNPQAFRDALAKACERNIPVVALKVGRTEEAARLTVSHSGAMAGDSAAYDALFDRYGVQQVRDMAELATLLILFSTVHPVGDGGLVALHDSGGERQLLVDLAHDAGVPLTRLQPATVAALAGVIEPELPAVNPLDAWSRGGATAADIMARSLSLMMQDPAAALGVLAHDRAPDGLIYESYLAYMDLARRESGKPVALVAAHQGSGSDPAVVRSTRQGVPVLDGIPAFLRGVRALFDYRDFRQPAITESVPGTPADTVARWSEALGEGRALDEHESLQLLRDFGMQANPGTVIDSREALLAAAGKLSYPLALKTAMPGVLHKSERNGVHLDLRTEAQLIAAWADLDTRCGPRALVAPMLGKGVEMILGARRDPQFGPIVMFGFGGIHAEVLHDVVFALPPFDEAWVATRLPRLALRPLLDGVRGMPAGDIAAFCREAARFSQLVHALRDVLAEADVNPLIVSATACTAADALIVGG